MECPRPRDNAFSGEAVKCYREMQSVCENADVLAKVHQLEKCALT